MEYVVIAIVALLVVGPERLPAMLNKLGKLVARARNMANEFRHSFDEMARQSELDDLRKEVEALRNGQNRMMPLGAEAEATFRSISDDLNRPLNAASPTAASPAPALTGPEEWPDAAPVMEPLEAEPEAAPAPKPRKAPAKKTPAAKSAPAKTAAPKAPAATKPKTTRKKAVDL
ncbi:Sec-independent protein translocase protein TatB [Brevundimonas sp. GCM10030266]|uniref:Sec-independent protein translocase protein TatB n=1 Tax=Brevundimonas sp. GCM10030266 TaxID=3273386 RepID=UPI00361AD217